MEYQAPELLYESRPPYLAICYFMTGVCVLSYCLVIIASNLYFYGWHYRWTGRVPENIPFDYQLFKAIMVPFILFGMIVCLLGVHLYRRSFIYSTGVIPNVRPVRMLFRPNSYFIPFSEIAEIGYINDDGGTPYNYWFLMKDGSLAHCIMYFSGKEGREMLAGQLKKQRPDITSYVRIGFPLWAKSSTPGGISPKEMVWSVYGKGAPVRYYSPL
jgi:hypothetical protein